MSFFGLFGSPHKGSANQAKERLQQVLANDRQVSLPPDFLPSMQEELRWVIGRYIRDEGHNVSMEVLYTHGQSVLEVNVILPAQRRAVTN
ncbi:MAG: cell division topological specificity factor MinE [Alphaproteobacteria bacterium]